MYYNLIWVSKKNYILLQKFAIMHNFSTLICSDNFYCISAEVHFVTLTLFQELAHYSQCPDDTVIETGSKYYSVGILMRS
jgi:hypothetical protein